MMMKRIKLLALCSCILISMCGVGYAVIIHWDVRVRPPVSLREALDISEKFLGDEAANRYCVSATLYGRADKQGKSGIWNLDFAAADESHKYIGVYMNREVSFDPVLRPSERTWRDISQIQTDLAELFNDEDIQISLSEAGDRLVGSFRTRNYRFYERKLDGSYADTLSDEIGPEHDGVYVEAKTFEMSVTSPLRHEQFPYWHEYSETYPIDDSGRTMSIKVRFGNDAPAEIRWRIISAIRDKKDSE
jgi:hypothetical protein